MRICVVHPSFSGSLGGTEKVSYEIAACLSKDHEVSHITEFNESSSDLCNLGIDERQYSEVSALTANKPLWLSTVELLPRFTLLKYAMKSRYWQNLIEDLQSDFDLLILTTGILTKDFNIDTPLIVYYHGAHTESKDILRKKFPYNALVRLFSTEKIVGDLHLYNSAFTAGKFQELGLIVYPPVRNEYNFKPQNNKKAVYFGRFSPEKRMEDAIKLCEQADIDLTLMGFKHDKNHVESLKDLAGSNVTFKFDVSYKEAKKTLENSQFGINCSKDYEGFGITTVEYMKSGTIPVVRASAANKETVELSALKFETISEGASKVDELLRDSKVRKDAIDYIKTRGAEFSSEKFQNNIKNAVSEFLDESS